MSRHTRFACDDHKHLRAQSLARALVGVFMAPDYKLTDEPRVLRTVEAIEAEVRLHFPGENGMQHVHDALEHHRNVERELNALGSEGA